MISCGYNGWTDAPEEEREGLDVFEASRTQALVLVPRVRPLPAPIDPQRKAA